MSERNYYEILWTGGWDSTYRMVELSRMPVTVQPYYIVDPKRITLQRELWGIDAIYKKLLEKEETVAEIRKPILVNIDDITPNQEITEAWKLCNEKFKTGAQFEYLARFAIEHPYIELCYGKDDTVDILNRKNNLKEVNAKLVQTEHGLMVNKDIYCEQLYTIFGNFCAPLFYTTEKEEYENIKKWKYEDVMSLIWFCQHPIHNRPCGYCEPCKTKITAGMTSMFSTSALIKGFLYRSSVRLIGNSRTTKIHTFLKRNGICPEPSVESNALMRDFFRGKDFFKQRNK